MQGGIYAVLNEPKGLKPCKGWLSMHDETHSQPQFSRWKPFCADPSPAFSPSLPHTVKTSTQDKLFARWLSFNSARGCFRHAGGWAHPCHTYLTVYLFCPSPTCSTEAIPVFLPVTTLLQLSHYQVQHAGHKQDWNWVISHKLKPWRIRTPGFWAGNLTIQLFIKDNKSESCGIQE